MVLEIKIKSLVFKKKMADIRVLKVRCLLPSLRSLILGASRSRRGTDSHMFVYSVTQGSQINKSGPQPASLVWYEVRQITRCKQTGLSYKERNFKMMSVFVVVLFCFVSVLFSPSLSTQFISFCDENVHQWGQIVFCLYSWSHWLNSW